MTKEQAIEQAKLEKTFTNVPIAIVNNPYAEDRNEPYCYCPADAAEDLFHHGTVEQIV